MKDPNTEPRKRLLYIIICAIAIIYNISPVDFIPDIVPVAGSIDDAVLALIPMIMGWQSYKSR